VCSALEAAVGRRDIKIPNKNQFISSLRPNFLSFAACIVLAIVGLEDVLKKILSVCWRGLGRGNPPGNLCKSRDILSTSLIKVVSRKTQKKKNIASTLNKNS
jgi:hypothetical protein